MRPVGEVRQALLDAALALATLERAPTLVELAAHSGVGLTAASTTLKNMVRTGALRIPRTRRVSYRNRPVAEYAPAQKEAHCDAGSAALATCWMVRSE
jgi:plasmid stability protein